RDDEGRSVRPAASLRQTVLASLGRQKEILRTRRRRRRNVNAFFFLRVFLRVLRVLRVLRDFVPWPVQRESGSSRTSPCSRDPPARPERLSRYGEAGTQSAVEWS